MDGGLKICFLLGFVMSTSAVLFPDSCEIGSMTAEKTLGIPVCCTFPFKFKDKTYHSCTLENSPGDFYWCSTSLIPNLDASIDVLHVWKERCVDGGWSAFGEWTKWSKCLDNGNERRFRYRECNSPVPDPDKGGRGCIGEDKEKEIRDCLTRSGEPVDGGWSAFGKWTNWSKCLRNGNERRFRYRKCNNPAPENGGSKCVGRRRQKQIRDCVTR